MRPDNVRLKGFLKLLGGSTAFAVGFWIILNYSEQLGQTYRGPVWPAIAAGAPGAFALVGLLELCSGVRFRDLAGAWDSLPEWQRWVLGALIVLIALAVVSGVFLGLAWYGII